jgi:hypothetical protein
VLGFLGRMIIGADPFGALFKTIPVRSEVMTLLESDDAAAALIECERMEQRHFDQVKYTNWPQWREFLSA